MLASAAFIVVAHVAPAFLLLAVFLAPYALLVRVARRFRGDGTEEPADDQRSRRQRVARQIGGSVLIALAGIGALVTMPVVAVGTSLIGSALLYPIVSTTIAGPFARDCGTEFFPGGGIGRPSAMLVCAEDALASGDRFKARSEGGIDSFMWSAAVRGPFGLYMVSFDSCPSGEILCMPSASSERCRAIDLEGAWDCVDL